jgi:hypothetical protein
MPIANFQMPIEKTFRIFEVFEIGNRQLEIGNVRMVDPPRLTQNSVPNGSK